MKRIFALVLSLLTLCIPLSACGQQEKPQTESLQANSVSQESELQDEGTKKLSIVCTIFPQYDWVRQILGSQADKVDLTLLLDNGIDLHSYQPTVDDIMKVATSDLFIYVGGESDQWVVDALKEATNPDLIALNLLDILGEAAKIEEVIEGMQPEEEEEEEGPAFDEHVWLSLKNAETISPAIFTALSTLDAANASEYQSNLDAYMEKLKALDAQYQAAIEAAPVKTLLFGDRFPFRYLVDDYGLRYHAAFVGCSTETEASFQTIEFLANKVNELSLKNVMVIESSDQSIAKTIVDNTENKNQSVLVMDSIQSITTDDVTNGITYLSIMENNLTVLKNALQ